MMSESVRGRSRDSIGSCAGAFLGSVDPEVEALGPLSPEGAGVVGFFSGAAFGVASLDGAFSDSRALSSVVEGLGGGP
jgi:hypothetical protein